MLLAVLDAECTIKLSVTLLAAVIADIKVVKFSLLLRFVEEHKDNKEDSINIKAVSTLVKQNLPVNKSQQQLKTPSIGPFPKNVIHTNNIQ
jgi:hypothetical protein